MNDLKVGDFVQIKDDYMWSDGGWFKNAHWVIDKVPVRVLLIVEDSLIIRASGVPYGPIPTSKVQLLWRPEFPPGTAVALPGDVAAFPAGTKGEISETLCLKSKGRDEPACLYKWIPADREDKSLILTQSHLEE